MTQGVTLPIRQALAYVEKIPRGVALVEKSGLEARGHAGVAHGATADIVDHAEGIHAMLESTGLDGGDIVAELLAEHLVGVDGEDVGPPGERCGILAL